MLVEPGLLRLGAGRDPIGDQLPGPAHRGLLEVAAADAAPGVVGADHHLGAGIARCVAAHLDHGDQHAGQPVPAQLLRLR